jgi:hypothetical protein
LGGGEGRLKIFSDYRRLLKLIIFTPEDGVGARYNKLKY